MSEFLREKGTAVDSVVGGPTTNQSQSGEQIERTGALLREEYISQVVIASGESWLELLDAVRVLTDQYRYSASGYESLTPRGITLQGGGELWIAVPMFVGERQAVHRGGAGSLTEVKKLKLKPHDQIRVDLWTEQCILHPTFRVSFREPIHEDLVGPRGTCLRGISPTDRHQGKERVNQTRYLNKWKGGPSGETSRQLERSVWHGGSIIKRGGLNPPMRTSGLIGGGELSQV